jgi:hypothetical protein
MALCSKLTLIASALAALVACDLSAESDDLDVADVETLEVGQRLRNLTGVDDEGEVHELFASAGRPVVIEVSSAWCGPCQTVDAFLAGSDNELAEHAEWVAMREAVASGRVVWIEYLSEGFYGAPASEDDLARYSAHHANDMVSILRPDDVEELERYLGVGWYPFFVPVDEDLCLIDSPRELDALDILHTALEEID